MTPETLVALVHDSGALELADRQACGEPGGVVGRVPAEGGRIEDGQHFLALAQTLDHAGKRHGLVHREVGALPRQLR